MGKPLKTQDGDPLVCDECYVALATDFCDLCGATWCDLCFIESDHCDGFCVEWGDDHAE